MTFRLVLAILGAAAAIPAQVAQSADASKLKARLEGRTVSLTTGEMVRKATLRLRMVGTVGMAGTPANNQVLVAATDSEGKFVFEDVDPGRYILTAERSGFVTQTYSARSGHGSTPLTLDSGQQIKDIVFKMVPQGIISGKVVDEDGDPLANSQIQIFRYGYNRGSRQLMPRGGSSTNPEGAFMIGGLEAGRYFLAVNPGRTTMGGPSERSATKGPVESYVMTYYPSAIDVASAVPIDVNAGQEVRNAEIRMRKQQVFSIRGKVAANAPVQNLMLMLISKGSETIFMGRQNAMIRDKEGSFEFHNIAAGTYLIQSQPNGMFNGEKTPALAARYEVTVSDHNIEDLVVPLSPLAEIAGTVKIEGSSAQQVQQKNAAATGSPAPGTPGASNQQIMINLQATEGISFNTPNARAADDGTFQLKNIGPEKYRVNVFNLPAGTYVKSIRFGSQEVAHAELDLSSGSGGALDIVLSPNAGDVSGVVRDANGSTVAGILVSVWIPGSTEPPKAANTDQNGAFKIASLAPGDYKLLAWEDVEPGLAMDPDFRKRFESQAAAVSVKENSHESAEVKMTPKDAIDAEAAKVK